MFNKFKVGEKVYCSGKGKMSGQFISDYGTIVEKDYYYKDYCVLFKDGTEEWFKESDINKINGNNGGKK